MQMKTFSKCKLYVI